MKILQRWAAMFLCVIMICCSVLFVCAEERSVSVSIPVSLSIQGQQPEEGVFQIQILPQSAECPMPEDGSDILTVYGAGDFRFAPICYMIPGVFQYKLKQLPGDAACIYDDSEFNLSVTVADNGENLEVVAVVYQDDKNEKLGSIEFTNSYESVMETETETVTEKAEAPETGDGSRIVWYSGLLLLSGLVLLYINKKRTENL